MLFSSPDSTLSSSSPHAQSAKGFTGPTLGPKLATETPRAFTEQQLSAAVAAPRMFGGVGSTMASMNMAKEMTASNPFASLNVVAQGMTMEAKINSQADKIAALERRLDLIDLREEARRNAGCRCSVM